jgi:opacity protein-like surface antigen
MFFSQHKILKTALLTGAVLVSSLGIAGAEEYDLKPYVGFDLQRTVADYNSNYNYDGDAIDANTLFEDSLDGVNVHAGIRPHRNFGVEAGYFRTQEEDKNIPTGASVGNGFVTADDLKTSVKLSGFTLDGLGYLPVANDKVDLIGTAGLSYIKGETEIKDSTDTYKDDESEIGYRVGGGAQFNITEQVNVRGLARYQTVDFDDVADSAWTYSVGLNYSF